MPPVVMAGVDLAPRVDDGDDGLTGEVRFPKAGLLHAGGVAEASHVVGAKPTVTTEFLGTFGHPRLISGTSRSRIEKKDAAARNSAKHMRQRCRARPSSTMVRVIATTRAKALTRQVQRGGVLTVVSAVTTQQAASRPGGPLVCSQS